MKWQITLAAVISTAALAVAQDAIMLKMYKPQAGDLVKQNTTDIQKMTIDGSAGGMPVKQDNARTVKLEFTDKVLKAEKSKATHYERTFHKASVEIMGQSKTIDAVEGKTVVVERTNNQWSFKVDGKDLDPATKEMVFRDSNKNDDDDTLDKLLPKNAVKNGESWKVDVGVVAKELSEAMAIDVAKSTGTGKLVKSYKKGNVTYGVLEITLDLAVTQFGKGAEALPLKDGAKLSITFNLDACVDGTEETGAATMTMIGKMASNAPMVDINIAMDFKMQGTKEHVRK